MMKSFARILPGACAALCLLAFTGCALLEGQIESGAKAAGKLVTSYCENITSPDVREEFRAKVNQYSSPHAVRVDCAEGIAPPLISTPVRSAPAQ